MARVPGITQEVGCGCFHRGECGRPMAGSLSYFGKVQRGTGGCFDPLFLCVVSHYFSICLICVLIYFWILLISFNHFVSHLHICPHSTGLSPPVSSFFPFFCRGSGQVSRLQSEHRRTGSQPNRAHLSGRWERRLERWMSSDGFSGDVAWIGVFWMFIGKDLTIWM